MKTFFRILLPCLFASGIYAQNETEKHSDLNKNGSSFPGGTYIHNGVNRLYFNACDDVRGNQLYEFDGNQLIRLSSFKDSWMNPDIKEKRQSNRPLGALCVPITLQGEKLYFFARGELTKPALYAHYKGIISEVFPTTSIGPVSALYKGNLLCEVEMGVKHPLFPQKNRDTLGRRVELLQISPEGSVKPFAQVRPDYQNCFADGMVVLGEELFVSKGGRIYSGKGKTMTADSRFNPYKQASGLFQFGQHMYFRAEKEGETGLYSYDSHGVFRYHGPQWPGKMLIHNPGIAMGEQFAYFAAGTESGIALFQLSRQAVLTENPAVFSTPGGAFIESMAVASEQLFITLRRPTDNSFSISQWNKDTLLPVEIRYQYDTRNLTIFNGQVFFVARSKNDGPELYAFEPMLPPLVGDYEFTVNDYNKNGYKIGTIEAGVHDIAGLTYEIVSGNVHDIFKLNPYTGVLSIEQAHRMEPDIKKSYNLKVRVGNRSIYSYCKVTVHIKPTIQFVFDGLQEKLLFFPDFSQKGVLTAENIPDGTVVNVYTIGQEMIDQLQVRNGSIQLGSYPTGIYILNIQGENNYYQRIEMQ